MPAAALVPNAMVVPGGAMAVGVPAHIKPGAVNPAMITRARDAYVRSCDRYRKELRRLA